MITRLITLILIAVMLGLSATNALAQDPPPGFTPPPPPTPIATPAPQYTPTPLPPAWGNTGSEDPCADSLYVNGAALIFYTFNWLIGLGRQSQAMVADGQSYANYLLANMRDIFGYIHFFNSITPAFSGLTALLLFWIAVMLIKITFSLIKWLKQIIPYFG